LIRSAPWSSSVASSGSADVTFCTTIPSRPAGR
jgi:hypothetical protein